MTPTIRALLAISEATHINDARWIACQALEREENAARMRIAARTYAVADGAPCSGATLLGENDGFTFEDVFTIDAIGAGETANLGGGASAECSVRRIS